MLLGKLESLLTTIVMTDSTMNSIHDDNDDDFGETFSESPLENDLPLEAEEKPCLGIQWQDWMIIGPASEEINKGKTGNKRLRQQRDIKKHHTDT
jgi:hypothetical protein